MSPTSVQQVEATLSPTEPAPAAREPAATPEPPAATAVPEPTQSPTPAGTPTPEPFQEELFLQLVNPAETQVIVFEPTIEIAARTRVDAVVTVNDTLLEPDIDGAFSLVVDLVEGNNVIEVVSSVASGEQKGLVLAVIYLP